MNTAFITQGIDVAIAKSVPTLMIVILLTAACRRGKTGATSCVLATIALTAAFYSAFHQPADQKLLWIGCGVLAAIPATISLLHWLRTTPTNNGNESTPQSFVASLGNLGIATLVVLLANYLLYSQSQQSFSTLNSQERWLANAQLIVLPLLIGFNLFVAIQLTLRSDELIRREGSPPILKWNQLHWIGFAMLLAEVTIAGFMLLKVDPNAELEALILPRLYGLTLLIMSLVSWMISSGILKIQQESPGSSKRGAASSQLASLTIASWLVCLALIVASSLPASWPWRSP